MNNTLSEIINWWSNIISWIQGFFDQISIYRWLRLFLYIVFLSSLLIRLYYSKKTFQKVNTLFRVSIDNLYYQTSKILYTEKSNIHNFKDNIPLLLQEKTQLINKRSKGNYYEKFDNIISEIEYIFQLTEGNKEISNKNDIKNQHNLLIKLINTINNINNTLAITTLGISKFFSIK